MWKQYRRQPTRVLVVDDEAPVRNAVRRALEAAGYEITEAANGIAGLAALESGAGFDLVVADLTMPELSGAEMVCRIRAARPDLKILYVTGFIDSLMDTRPLWEGEAFLEKPFSMVGLQQAVALLLHGSLTPPEPQTGIARFLNFARAVGI